ncbi:alpha/beta hydrolase [Nocardioides sp.]|uniref:alpha/beta hydrolase n=1 Tax=Nocardioides sp. TaxID=35761 RepID=UPI00260E196F|nr:alpha/beta hydrolase [Nocardioides sp.]
MLFPESRAALDHSAGEPPVFAPDYDIAAAREQARLVAAAQPREDVDEVSDVDAGGVPCRIYRPAGAAPGSVIHLHGGGFVFNDIDVHDASARRLANRSHRAVVSVDYRLAPEHPFPAAPDDVDSVLDWIEQEGPRHGLAGPLLAHGDSAGANLALVAALRHPGRFACLALIYPFLDPTSRFDSHRTETEGFDPREVVWYWTQYSGGDLGLYDDPDLAPLLSDKLWTLPPTLVMTSEHDPLRGEGEHLARMIAQQGVQVVATRYLGQLHGFWRHPDAFAAAEPLMGQVASFLRAHG